MTFLAALRHDRIDAPWFIEGPIDGVSFRTYVEKVLPPVLRPGDIVVLDNLGSHGSKAARQLIRSVGAKLFFLPKYSPDLNPIEQVFAKLKHLLRKAARVTVTVHLTPNSFVRQPWPPLGRLKRRRQLGALSPMRESIECTVTIVFLIVVGRASGSCQLISWIIY